MVQIQPFSALPPPATTLSSDSQRQVIAAEPGKLPARQQAIAPKAVPAGATVSISQAAREALAAVGSSGTDAIAAIPGEGADPYAGAGKGIANGRLSQINGSLTDKVNRLTQSLNTAMASVSTWA